MVEGRKQDRHGGRGELDFIIKRDVDWKVSADLIGSKRGVGRFLKEVERDL